MFQRFEHTFVKTYTQFLYPILNYRYFGPAVISQIRRLEKRIRLLFEEEARPKERKTLVGRQERNVGKF